MGASAWCYFVPYQQDIGSALATLREDVFRSGSGEHALVSSRRAALYWSQLRGGTITRKELTRRLAELAQPAGSIRDLVARAGEDGTHSILDVDRVVDSDALARLQDEAVAIERDFLEGGDQHHLRAALFEHLGRHEASPSLGAITPLTPDEYDELFGTREPTREVVEAQKDALYTMRGRWYGVFIVVFREGQPHELCFVGYSGD